MGQAKRKKEAETRQTKRSVPIISIASGVLAAACIAGYVMKSSPQGQETRRDSLDSALEPYGSVVWQKRGSGNQVCYVIGQEHQNLFWKTDEDKNAGQSQLEVLRTIERIWKQDGTQLVLREGMSSSKEWDELYKMMSSGMSKNAASIRYDDVRTRQVLNEVRGLDAIMLAGAIAPIQVRSAEDERLIERQHKLVKKWALMSEREREEDMARTGPFFMAVADYRSARILQNMPKIVEEEYQSGRIKSRSAMIVIGAAHLDEMIRFVDMGRIQLDNSELGPINEEITANSWTYKFILPNSTMNAVKAGPALAELKAILYK